MTRSVVATLRDFVPVRPLTRHEALSIAERQAQRFLQLSELSSPPTPERAISELPRIRIERVGLFPASGATHWVNGCWLIVLNATEPATRQRFSLAHELKHILDHPFVDQLYGAIDTSDRQAWVEQVCDYFAGCVLMPRPWLKRAFTTEMQDTARLAARFHVSQAAMRMRLNQIGLVDPSPRCDRRTPPARGDDPFRSQHRYHRRASLEVGAAI